MVKKFFISWCIFHLLFTVFLNFLGSYNSYYEYHHMVKGAKTAEVVSGFFNIPVMKFYGRYTGAESGYGFFGINVRSNGALAVECNRQKLTPQFRSFETSLRFFSLSNGVTDNYLQPERTDSNRVIQDENALHNKYNNLVLKNIAVTLAQKNNCADTSILLSYHLLNFPTLAQVRSGAPKEYQLVKLIALKYSIR